MKTLVGGELKGLSQLTRETRQELFEEAIQEAIELGANAVLGMRLETNTIFEGTLDMVLSGTAVYMC